MVEPDPNWNDSRIGEKELETVVQIPFLEFFFCCKSQQTIGAIAGRGLKSLSVLGRVFMPMR